MTHTKICWFLFAFAALSFLPTLNFYYVGEEAVFPISSLEMWQRNSWMKQYLYGMDVQHNPLFNWLIMSLSTLAGWEHVLLVTRSLTIGSTLATGLVLAWLTNRLFRDAGFAAFAAVAYISMADVLLYRGWLGYVDPLFALFIFAAISMLWVGAREQCIGFLLAAAALISCAFLSKAFTAYVFYGATLFALLFDSKLRAFLFRPPSLLIQAAVIAIPIFWFSLIPSGTNQSGRMFAEILYKLAFPPLGDYLARLVMYPLEIFIWLSPITILAAYFLLRKRNQPEEDEFKRVFNLVCWIAFLNFLPYWFSPQGGSRYLLPIYPLLALIAARIVWQSGGAAQVSAKKWIIAALLLKLILALTVFPYYQAHYRGQNYNETAADILKGTKGYALYVTDVSAPGLSVTAYLNQRRYPSPALQWPPSEWQSGYVISRTADSTQGEIFKRYPLGGDELYLLCRGQACQNKVYP